MRESVASQRPRTSSSGAPPAASEAQAKKASDVSAQNRSRNAESGAVSVPTDDPSLNKARRTLPTSSRPAASAPATSARSNWSCSVALSGSAGSCTGISLSAKPRAFMLSMS